MKIIFTLLFISSLAVIAQEDKIEATFKNGEEKTVYVNSNPYNIPKVTLNVHPLCFGNTPKTIAGLSFEPRIRFNNKVGISMSVVFPIDEVTDENHTSFSENKYKDIRFLGHYNLFNKIKIENEDVSVDYNYDSEADATVVYKLNIPRQVLYSFNGDFGFSSINYGSKFDIEVNDIPDSAYFGGDIKSVGLVFGGSFEKIKSIRVRVDDASRSYFRINRFYSNVTIGFKNNYDIYDSNYDKVENFKSLNLVDLSPVSWKLGYQYQHGLKNVPIGFSFGYEVGSLPSYDLNSSIGTFDKKRLCWRLKLGIMLGAPFKHK